MQNKILQEIVSSLEVTRWLIGVVGTLLIFSGGLIVYIFTSHKNQNDREHRSLFNKTDKHETRISTIEGACNGKKK